MWYTDTVEHRTPQDTDKRFSLVLWENQIKQETQLVNSYDKISSLKHDESSDYITSHDCAKL